MSWLSKRVERLRLDPDAHSVMFVRGMAELVGSDAIKEAARICYVRGEHLRLEAVEATVTATMMREHGLSDEANLAAVEAAALHAQADAATGCGHRILLLLA